ncbi:mannonate dehydratase [Membranihabitans marinus]|uniref:mannonate dehydratase n=1 Tax=Membranihabitans marinus TaxID=1227546 RepID=UPI001F0059C8|nr:mannonate dehydratase [Membranihabitans marinus]
MAKRKYIFKHTMKWHGPSDQVSLINLVQSGAEGVVTTLENIAIGEVWTEEKISERKAQINSVGLDWTVAESLPVHEDIKLGASTRDQYIEKYKLSLRNLSEAGVKVIAYNFMPLFDWMRTDWYYTLEDGSLSTHYDHLYIVAFDLFVLERKNVSYPEEIIIKAEELFKKLLEQELESLTQAVLRSFSYAGLGDTIEDLKINLAKYDDMDQETLRSNWAYFIESILPVVEECGIQLAIHPDDPPYNLFGIPRITSTSEDIQWLMNRVKSKNNGLCFCTGALGAQPDNKLTDIVKEWKDRIHYLHLRSVKVLDKGVFYETSHLEGDVNLYSIIKEFADSPVALPIRPDHGHAILDDLGKEGINPGYTCIGRMQGLTAVKGIEYALIQGK